MSSGNISSRKITYDKRAFLVAGRRKLLLSGEIHYARSPRELWPALLDHAKGLGLNCIASYIFWNWHEPEKDVYDSSGDRDLGHFLALCAERDFDVILRAGPYCCAEWNFGGYPPYLRDEPGIVIRTWNGPYMRRVEKYFSHLMPEIRPYLASNGGPVILVQVENEYANVAKRILKSKADFRLDAEGLGKGMLFINGHALGRHWLIEANGYGGDEAWHNRELDGLSLGPAGEPTQRFYHVPRAWLSKTRVT